jgi:6-phosphofructokinase 1
VPKTIDNDLPLPEGIPTFGFETAREHGTAVVERLILDMETTNRWFFVVMMGRSAGHLALGAGKSAGAPITLIPEEFPNPPIAIDDVVRMLEGAIVKRLAQGRPDGVAVIAEGVASAMDPNDPLLADAPRDEHGHVRLAEVPLARVLRTAVTESLASARRTSATSCAAAIRSPSTATTRATSASAPSTRCSRVGRAC